jgi:hypothetical protein
LSQHECVCCRKAEKEKEEHKIFEKLKRQRFLSEQNRIKEERLQQGLLQQARDFWAGRNVSNSPAAAVAPHRSTVGSQQPGILERTAGHVEWRQKKREEEDKKIQKHKDEQRRRSEELERRRQSDGTLIRERTRMHWAGGNDGGGGAGEHREADDPMRDSNQVNQNHQAERGVADDEDDGMFVCPITTDLFEDPVEASDGIVYERRFVRHIPIRCIHQAIAFALTNWFVHIHHTHHKHQAYHTNKILTRQAEAQSIVAMHTFMSKMPFGIKEFVKVQEMFQVHWWRIAKGVQLIHFFALANVKIDSCSTVGALVHA